MHSEKNNKFQLLTARWRCKRSSIAYLKVDNFVKDHKLIRRLRKKLYHRPRPFLLWLVMFHILSGPMLQHDRSIEMSMGFALGAIVWRQIIGGSRTYYGLQHKLRTKKDAGFASSRKTCKQLQCWCVSTKVVVLYGEPSIQKIVNRRIH